jgi:hypothetical protein
MKPRFQTLRFQKQTCTATPRKLSERVMTRRRLSTPSFSRKTPIAPHGRSTSPSPLSTPTVGLLAVRYAWRYAHDCQVLCSFSLISSLYNLPSCTVTNVIAMRVTFNFHILDGLLSFASSETFNRFVACELSSDPITRPRDALPPQRRRVAHQRQDLGGALQVESSRHIVA